MVIQIGHKDSNYAVSRTIPCSGCLSFILCSELSCAGVSVVNKNNMRELTPVIYKYIKTIWI